MPVAIPALGIRAILGRSDGLIVHACLPFVRQCRPGFPAFAVVLALRFQG